MHPAMTFGSSEFGLHSSITCVDFSTSALGVPATVIAVSPLIPNCVSASIGSGDSIASCNNF